MVKLKIVPTKKIKLENRAKEIFKKLKNGEDVDIDLHDERVLCMVLENYKDLPNVVVQAFDDEYSVREAYYAFCEIGVDPFVI